MKRVCLSVLILLALCGCRKLHVGEAVHEGFGLPCAGGCRGTAIYDDLSIEYAIMSGGDSTYSFSGRALARGRHASGRRIQSAAVYLLLIRQEMVADTVRLNLSGMDISRPLRLFKNFHASEGFEAMEFAWHIHYYD